GGRSLVPFFAEALNVRACPAESIRMPPPAPPSGPGLPAPETAVVMACPWCGGIVPAELICADCGSPIQPEELADRVDVAQRFLGTAPVDFLDLEKATAPSDVDRAERRRLLDEWRVVEEARAELALERGRYEEDHERLAAERAAIEADRDRLSAQATRLAAEESRLTADRAGVQEEQARAEALRTEMEERIRTLSDEE